MSSTPHTIGIFDSGYGGLTVFKSVVQYLPHHNYIYLGDNSRAPYGNRSFDTIYRYTWQCVEWLFKQGCSLVVLACNTASAKALQRIQKENLPAQYPNHRVLGVIRPTAEAIGDLTRTKKIGVLGTRGTVRSNAYVMEIRRLFPDMEVFQQSCPMWVPLIENGEHTDVGADYFVEKYIRQLTDQSKQIDTVLLACTHYPLLAPKIKKYIPTEVKLLEQGQMVATSLVDYLYRHPEIDGQLGKNGKTAFYTTGDTYTFDQYTSLFLQKNIKSAKAKLL